MASFSNGSEFSFTKSSKWGTWGWKISTQLISGAGSKYFITEIRGPFGKLSDVDSPIPSDIFDAMAQTLYDVKSQQSAALTVVTSSVNGTVTEAGGLTQIGSISITNSGAYGSFLNCDVTTTNTWLKVSPVKIIGLSKSDIATVTVTVDPASLLSDNSPYSSTIVFRPENTNDVISIPVAVAVVPRPIILVDAELVSFSFDCCDQLHPEDVTVNIFNDGPAYSLLSVTIDKLHNTSPWLSFSESYIENIGSGNSVPVTFSINNAYVPRISGVFSDTIRIQSANANNSPYYLYVSINVS